jgi:hypothetical protein
VNFNFQPLAMFVLLFFCKSVLIKSCSSFEDLSAYKILGSTLTGAMFATNSIWNKEEFAQQLNEFIEI